MDIVEGEPVSLICSVFSELHDEYSRLVQNIDFLKACETEVVNNVKETADNYLQSEKVAVVINLLNSVLKVTAEGNKCLQQKVAEIKNLLKSNIHYVSCGPQSHSFRYIGGDSPWNFWLQDTTVDIKVLHKTLLEKYENKDLKKLCSLPNVNAYVCYIERNKVFRGKVLRLLEDNRVKLVDVDTSCVKRIHQGSLYEMDDTTCKVHALAVNCCLSQDFQDERMWCTDLGKMFADVLANGILFLDIHSQLNDTPIFLVNVQVTAEDGNCVNMQEWVCERIIPELRSIFDKGLEPVADYLSPRALDAYFQQYTNETLNNKTHLCEKISKGDSDVCQYNSENTCNALQIENQSFNFYEMDSREQKLKTDDLPELRETSDSLFLTNDISDYKVTCGENNSQDKTSDCIMFSEGSKNINNSNSCVSISQVREEVAVPEEKSTVSECESTQKCMKQVEDMQENKSVVDLLDVCKNVKQVNNDNKGSGDKTEVDNGRYVQNSIVNKPQSICQVQGRNMSYLPAPYQSFMYTDAPGFVMTPFFNNSHFVPSSTLPSPSFHSNIVPTFGYTRSHASITVPSNSNFEKNSSNYIPYKHQFSRYKIEVPHYSTWSDNTNLSEGVGKMDVAKENNYSPLSNNSVNLRESSVPGIFPEHKNKTYTVHKSIGGSSVTLPAHFRTSYVKERDSTQNYTEVLNYNQKVVSPVGYKTGTQHFEETDTSCVNGSKNYHVNLRKPSTLLKEGGKLKVILSHVVNPWKFYVHFPNENNTYIDKLKEDMKNYYSAYELHSFSSYPWFKLKEILGTFCACHWNSCWYRVEVLDWHDAGKARVFFVDYGNEESVFLSALQPLCTQFTEYNMMAQHCHLANVFPINSEDNCWPENAKQFFCSLIDCETPCTVTVISSRNDHVSNSLGVILFTEDDSSSVNDIMVKEGVAMTPNRILKSQVNEHSKEGINRDQNNYIDESLPLRKSSPQAKYSYSTYNMYETDTDDAVVAVTGYKARDEMRICKFYARSGYCWKRICNKEHSLLNEAGVTADKVLVYNEAFTLLGLPDNGQVFDVKVTAVFSLSHFFVQMQENLSGFRKEDENELETLSSLTELINKSTNVKSLKHLTAHPSYSQLVLVRSEDGIWYRAQVMEMCETDKEYEVLYVDYGTVENISLDNMREIEPRYLHLPFQAIQCDLANVKLLEDNSVNERAADIFRDELVGHDLKAEVVNRYSQYNRLSLKLFCNKKGDIGEWLHSKGLCELAQNVKYDSRYIV